jgi:hypothetical protein
MEYNNDGCDYIRYFGRPTVIKEFIKICGCGVFKSKELVEVNPPHYDGEPDIDGAYMAGVNDGILQAEITYVDILSILRNDGWMVARHNDYKLGGIARTVWLVINDKGQYVLGDGKTDMDALRVIKHQVDDLEVSKGVE